MNHLIKIVAIISVFIASSNIALGIRGGRVANDNEAPFVVFVGNCAGSLVGKETLITTASCKGNNKEISFKFQGIEYSGVCKAHPQAQRNRIDFDISLCKFSPQIDKEELFARLEPIEPSANAKAFLTGFGASDSFGIKRIATVKIQAVNNGSFTVSGDGHIAAGDVGAPVFLDTDTVAGPFKLIGLAVAILSNTDKTLSIRLDRAAEFFADFAQDNAVRICGINDECIGNQNQCIPEREIVDFFKGELNNANQLLRECLEGF